MQSRWYFHPIFVFFFTLLTAGTSLFIYIRSYLQVNNAFFEFVEKNNLAATRFLDTQTWVLILILSVLVSMILLFMFFISVYYQKLNQLYRLQQNFINGFTHELKTPIASLRLFLDTFTKYNLPREEQQKYLELMKRDTTRLSDNVNQILNLARIEEKKYEASFQRIDLKQFLEEQLEKAKHLNEEIVITVTGEGDFKVGFDGTLMELVLMNLVTNAIHYNHAREKKLEIRFSSPRQRSTRGFYRQWHRNR